MQGRTDDKILAERKMQKKIKNLPVFVQDYYYYLNEKTYMTKDQYLRIIISFLNYLSGNNINEYNEENLNKITLITIKRYMVSIQYLDNGKEMSSSRKNLIYSAINSFLKYLKAQNYIESNPFEEGKIERSKPEDKDIIFLEPDEYSAIKRCIMNGTGSTLAKARQKEWMYRDLLLFQIPIITGVRVTALSQITLNDIDLKNKTISVIDKSKYKILYLDEETYNLLLVWIKIRNRLLDGYEDNPYLFISNQRKKMNVRTIRNIIEKYSNCITDKKITPHKLRSTCGTNLYRATNDIYLVAEVLGHNSPATTRKYTKVGTTERVNAAEILSKRMKK